MFKASGTLAGETLGSVHGAEHVGEGVAISTLRQKQLRTALTPLAVKVGKIKSKQGNLRAHEGTQ